MKVGLWLQDYRNSSEEGFQEVLDIVKASDIDIFVFPEASYTPFSELINNNDLLDDSSEAYFKKATETAEYIHKPTVFSDYDKYGTMFSYYYNPVASEDETVDKYYIKHTATNCSAYDFKNYDEFWAYHNFEPIVLKGKKIGLTICYDCNYSLYSRLYGVMEADIIINSTGGNVVHEKWFKYNQVRAIENECYIFVTMGYSQDKTINSYVFGFGPNGNPLPYKNLMHKNPMETNLVGSVYVYDTEDDDGVGYVDNSNQFSRKTEYDDIFIEAGNVDSLLKNAEQVRHNLYVHKVGDTNLVIFVCDNDEILYPEVVLNGLYDKELKKYTAKKYLIVSKWDKLDKEFFETKLSPVLKVRSMENFCAVILESDLCNKCYQCGNNRTAQVICENDGTFGLDFKRMGGPETIWRNKPGMIKAEWREHFEKVVYQLVEEE